MILATTSRRVDRVSRLFLILAPLRRQLSCMTANHASTKLDDRGRQTLRLDPEVWPAIDRARLRRAGSISRNTWITEAIAEKLAREQSTGSPYRQAGGVHVRLLRILRRRRDGSRRPRDQLALPLRQRFRSQEERR